MTLLRQRLSHAKTLLYRRPKDEFQRMLRWGPQAYFRIDAWMREMEEAASTLAAPPTFDLRPPISVWFLTGKRFWYQTAFCAWTLAKQSGRSLVLNLVDDGTLAPEHEEELRRIFPEGVILRRDAVRDRIESLLPTNRFPVLRRRWLDYVNIRKLTDIHLGSTGVKLVLDSDMLFFRRPDALLAWWDDCQRSNVSDQMSGCEIPTSDLRPPTSTFSPLLMTDCEESYGYSRALMEELAGAQIPRELNVGICGLRSEDLDWEEMELWCRTLVERESTSYYLEQALVAMLAARQAPIVMPRGEYITFPTQNQVRVGDGSLQHYVSDSKPWYFGQAWKLAMSAR